VSLAGTVFFSILFTSLLTRNPSASPFELSPVTAPLFLMSFHAANSPQFEVFSAADDHPVLFGKLVYV